MLKASRLRSIVAFEWRYHVRQPVFLAGAAFFAFFGCVVQANGFGQANVAVNSPYVVMFGTGFLSLMSVFAVAVFASNAILRDHEHHMDGIVFTTSVEKREYLGGRFVGVLLAAITVMAFSTIAMTVTMFTPFVDAERVAPFSPWPYIASFAVITIPNLVFAAVLMSGIAARTRSALATYAGAVVLYVLYFIVSALTNSPLMAASRPGTGGGEGLALLDPFGLSAFFESARLWTPAARNTRAIAFEPLLLGNRVLWLVAAAAIAVLVYRSFSFRRPAEPTSRRPHRVRPARFQPLLALARPYASCFSLQLRIFASKAFLSLLVIWIALATSEILGNVLDTEYGAALIPSTGLVIAALTAPLEIVGTILILFFGAEVYWRERRHRFTAILDATPLSNITILGAKAATLTVFIVIVVFTGVAPGIVLQLVRAPEHIDLTAYLALFAWAGVPLFASAIAMLFIHSVVRNKYAGIVLSLLFVVLTKQPALVGLDHPLWRYGGVPPLRYSEVSGFGFDVLPAVALGFHWLAVAAVLFLIASASWRMRREIPRRSLVVALLLSIGTTSWLLARMPPAEDPNAWKADYERTYRPLASLPQPRLTAVDTAMDFFDRRVHVSGRYQLVNTTAAPISRVIVAVRRELKDVHLQLAGARVRHDARLGMLDLTLQPPLAPGASAELRFSASLTRELFDFAGDDSIAPNGSFLMNMQLFPSIGYRPTWEIVAPRERRKYGLPLRQESAEGDVPSFAEDIRFAATISTPIDQTPAAPGARERTWTRGDRRYTRFTSARMRNFFGVAAASYEKRTRMLGATPIELLYVAAHAGNADRMLDIAAKALEVGEASFGPYAGAQLRMAEVPSSANFGALATPGTLFLTEHRTFLIDTSDPSRPDLLGRRIAHEVAHQWWGYQVAPGGAPGATFIVESLAKYGELLVVERLLGREQVREMLEVDRDRYLAGRAGDADGELPLLRAGGQSHLYYGKGAVVMHAMRDLLGEAALHRALRSFVTAESSRHGLTRATDILPHLRRVATDEQYALIGEWLQDITLYDLAIDSARQQGDALTVHVSARKRRADANGNETALPFREAITIRVTAADGTTLDERTHPLDGDDVLAIPVKGRAAKVEIDPWLTRIDTDLRNNVRVVTGG